MALFINPFNPVATVFRQEGCDSFGLSATGHGISEATSFDGAVWRSWPCLLSTGGEDQAPDAWLKTLLDLRKL